MSPSSSSRWCPTPEQLMILEELYRSGIRTPNASQIQRITAHLSLYGKIEGKNVFYWFQNHKARDRQKLRRKLIKQLQEQQQQHQQQLFHHHHLDLDHDLHLHQNQLHLFNPSTLNHHHQNLLNYFDLPPPPPPPPLLASSFHPLSTATLLPLHHQGGLEGAATQTMNGSTWNHVEYSQNIQTENQMMTTTRTYGHDWMTMMGIGPPSPCTKRPLETLELFPITATNLKEECHNSSTSSSSN